MSYDLVEASVSDGQPFLLFEFTSSAGTVTRLTNGAADLVKAGQTWTKSPLACGEIEQSGNIEKSPLELAFPLSDAFGASFQAVTSAVTVLTVFRGHHTDPTETLRVMWKGRFVGARAKRSQVIVTFETAYSSLRGTGCRARMMTLCRHAHYMTGCDLDRAAFEVAATVSAVNGRVLTVAEAAAAPANEYRAGIVDWNGLLGYVQRHAGDQLTLMQPLPGLAEEVAASGPAAIMLAPGCDLSLTRCVERFDNKLNNGGFYWMTSRNPFTSSIA